VKIGISFLIKSRTADYGLTACALVFDNIVEQLVLDGRVVGLGVEEKIVDWISMLLRKNGAHEIGARL
jgi:hypothetical protein